MTNPNPKPEVPKFTDPGPPVDGWKILTSGEREMLGNNYRELRSMVAALDMETALGRNPIDVSEGSLVWDYVGVIAGNLANIADMLFDEDERPID